MKSASVFALLALSLVIALPATAADFEPIPEAYKGDYRFDLEETFYEDEAAFEADLDTLVAYIDELVALKGEVTASAENLYRAYYLSDIMIPVWWKLWVFGMLTYATNTDEYEYLDRVEKTSGDLESRIQFVKTETQTLDDATLDKYMRHKPELAEYAFAIEEARRYEPHTLSLAEEELMAQLYPYLSSWSERLYQKCLDRTEFPDVVVEGDTLDTRLNYSQLINSHDRQVRKDAWQGYFGSYGTHKDLYAFTMIKAVETRNKLAKIRGHDGFLHSKFFDMHMSYEAISNLYEELASHAHIRKEYERVRQRRIRADSGYETVYIWDRTLQPEGFEVPRFEITEACKIIRNTLEPLGEEYQTELCSLLNPENHRLDIVSGPKRSSGMFSTGYPGGDYVFFSMAYNGYFTELRGLAHESGHAVHHMIQTSAGVKPIYFSGPKFVTESVAITNEFLISHRMYREEKDLETRAYYLEQFLEDALGLLTNNMFAHLEMRIYEGVEDGSIKEAEDLDRVVEETLFPYSMYYENHPPYKSVWALIHHYYDVPGYYVNYVLAQALSLVFMDRIINEPDFVEKYQAMLKMGFDRPGHEVVLETTGVDMMDPTVLQSGFARLEDLIAELDQLYTEMGI
jgi:oligoendopeptidase F